jgi:hypothetical protein
MEGRDVLTVIALPAVVTVVAPPPAIEIAPDELFTVFTIAGRVVLTEIALPAVVTDVAPVPVIVTAPDEAFTVFTIAGKTVSTERALPTFVIVVAPVPAKVKAPVKEFTELTPPPPAVALIVILLPDGTNETFVPPVSVTAPVKEFRDPTFGGITVLTEKAVPALVTVVAPVPAKVSVPFTPLIESTACRPVAVKEIAPPEFTTDIDALPGIMLTAPENPFRLVTPPPPPPPPVSAQGFAPGTTKLSPPQDIYYSNIIYKLPYTAKSK